MIWVGLWGLWLGQGFEHETGHELKKKISPFFEGINRKQGGKGVWN